MPHHVYGRYIRCLCIPVFYTLLIQHQKRNVQYSPVHPPVSELPKPLQVCTFQNIVITYTIPKILILFQRSVTLSILILRSEIKRKKNKLIKAL